MWNELLISLCLIHQHTMEWLCDVYVYYFCHAWVSLVFAFALVKGIICLLHLVCVIVWTCKVIILIYVCQLQIPHLRPAEYKRSRLPRNRRTVNRAYGGVLSGGAVRERFVCSPSEGLLLYSFYNFSFAVICLYLSLVLQDYPGFLGWRAKNCEEGLENSEGKRKAGLEGMNLGSRMRERSFWRTFRFGWL